MSKARDLAGSIPVLGALADMQEMLTPRGVGTVSQTGGVPTGAIVQPETSANGTYIRFADGTQICWGGITSSSAGHVTWTFPQPFTQAPRIQATCLAAANGRIAVYSNATATSADFGVYGTSNTALDGIFTSVMAVGRWY